MVSENVQSENTEKHALSWSEMSWKQKIRFVLGVLMGVSVKYYAPKSENKNDSAGRS